MKGRLILVCLLTAVALATAVFGCGKADAPMKAESVQAATQTDEPAAEYITVTVTIDGSKGGDKAISCKGEAKLTQSSTVFDALKILCDENGFEITGDPSYVKTIGGLGEGSFGATPCGWMYSVNGEYPPVAAKDCALKDGDVLVWEFVK